MKTQADLDAMSVPQKKAYADSLGLSVKGRHAEKELDTMILEKQDAPDVTIPDEPVVELQGKEFVTGPVSLESGATYMPAQIVEAAQRDSGLTPDEWNEAEDKELALEQFVDDLAVVNKTPKEVKVGKAKKEQESRIREALKPAIAKGLGFEVTDTFYTISYNGIMESGNLSVPDTQVANQAKLLLARFSIAV